MTKQHRNISWFSDNEVKALVQIHFRVVRHKFQTYRRITAITHIFSHIYYTLLMSWDLNMTMYNNLPATSHIAASFSMSKTCSYTGLFETIVRILTTCHTQYTSDRSICIFLFNITTLQVCYIPLQVIYMCTLCDSTNMPHLFFCHSRPTSVFPFTHEPCLLKLCIPPSNGTVRWWFFTEFGAELPLDNRNWPTFMKCKHTKRLLVAFRRHLSELRSKRRNA